MLHGNDVQKEGSTFKVPVILHKRRWRVLVVWFAGKVEGERRVEICQNCFCIYSLHWRRQWHHTPVLLPGKSHGWRSLVGCSPWGREELNTTERLYFDFSLSCMGEENGNPLQCSCLENPRDRGAWWAAVYGVAQSWTQLKRLSGSSNAHHLTCKTT